MLKKNTRDRTEIKNPPYYNDLPFSFSHSAEIMFSAVKNAKSPLHIGVLGYINAATSAPTQRSVVLRFAAPDLKELGFHTDIRSEKIASIQKNPNCSILFYDTILKIQLVFSGKITLHHKNPIALKAWEKTAVMSRRCYMAQSAPGAVSPIPTAGFDEKYTMNEQEENDTVGGYENFCVARMKVEMMDRVFLSFTGNRRARFTLKDDAPPEGEWLIP